MKTRLAAATPLILLVLLSAAAQVPCPVFFTLAAFLFSLSTFVVFVAADYRRGLELNCILKRKPFWSFLLRKRIFNLFTAGTISLLLIPLALELHRTPGLGYTFFLLLAFQTTLYILLKAKFSKLLHRGWLEIEASDLSLAVALPTLLLLYLLAHYYFLPLSQPLKPVDYQSLLALKNEIFSKYKCPPSAGYIYLSEVFERLVWSIALTAASFVKISLPKLFIFAYLTLKGVLLLGAGGKLWSETLKVMEITKN